MAHTYKYSTSVRILPRVSLLLERSFQMPRYFSDTVWRTIRVKHGLVYSKNYERIGEYVIKGAKSDKGARYWRREPFTMVTGGIVPGSFVY